MYLSSLLLPQVLKDRMARLSDAPEVRGDQEAEPFYQGVVARLKHKIGVCMRALCGCVVCVRCLRALLAALVVVVFRALTLTNRVFVVLSGTQTALLAEQDKLIQSSLFSQGGETKAFETPAAVKESRRWSMLDDMEGENRIVEQRKEATDKAASELDDIRARLGECFRAVSCTFFVRLHGWR